MGSYGPEQKKNPVGRSAKGRVEYEDKLLLGLGLPSPDNLLPVKGVEPAGADLLAELGDEDEDLLAGPAERRRHEEHVAFDVLLDGQLGKAANVLLLLVFGPTADGYLRKATCQPQLPPLSFLFAHDDNSP